MLRRFFIVLTLLPIFTAGCATVNSNLQPMNDNYPVTIFQETLPVTSVKLAVTCVDPQTDEVMLTSAVASINGNTMTISQVETLELPCGQLTLTITKSGYKAFNHTFLSAELADYRSRAIIIRLMPENALTNSLLVR